MMKFRFKNICWSCLAFFALAVGSVFLVMSCKTDADFEELKAIPVMDESGTQDTWNPKNYLKGFDIGRHFSQQKSKNWVDTKVPTDFKVVMLDGRYREVDYYHFRKFNNWFKKLLFEAGIQSGVDFKHSVDCDNFAMMYKSLMSVSAYKSKDTIEMAVAVVVVQQVNEFGGIPATGGLHMVNLVFTTHGWLVLEPQTMKYIKLEEYPNQEYFQYMIL